MKKTNILDFFKLQSQAAKVSCPACGVPIFESKLNYHLDSLCASVIPSSSATESPKKREENTSQQTSISKRKARSATTSNRLCLKSQRNKKSAKSIGKFLEKPEKETEMSEDDVMIVNEVRASPDKKKTSQLTSESVKSLTSLEEKNLTNHIKNNSPEDGIQNISDKFSLSSAAPSFSPTNNTVVSSNSSSKRKKSIEIQVSIDSNPNSSFEFGEGAKKGTPTKRRKSRKSYLVKQNSNKEMNDLSNNSKQVDDDSTKRKRVTKNESVSRNKKIKDSAEIVDEANLILIDSLSNQKNIIDDDTSSQNALNPDINDLLDDAKQISENDVFSELSDSNDKETKSYTPYYIANFKYILEAVLKDEDNKNLFNDEDRKSIKAFKKSSDAAQKLYVRLFQRKYKWLRLNKINYPEITKDPYTALEELVGSGLVDSGTSGIELETAIELLSLPEAKNLAKYFNFTSGKSKSEIKVLLLKHCKEHKSVFFTNGNNGISGMMLKKVKNMVGPCYRISLLPKRLFTRVLMLFSLPTISEDDDEAAGGQQQQLITLLQVNKGELVFPVCKRKKETVIFCDRNELIRYEEARQLENDIFNAVENKNFELAKDLYINAKKEFEEQCLCEFSKRSSSLPAFLKRYTSFHVYIRCMTQGVDALQKLRQYKEAVALLKKLLKQKVYCQDYKGRWYDRLALNLEQHLKQPQNALEAIKQGLKDKNVRVGHRYSLLTRALRITKSFDEEDEFRKQILKDFTVNEAPKVIIQGRLCPRSILGRRHVFISSSVTADEDDVTVLGVEQLALEHYKEEGFTEGVHGEGSTFISLYALLFWDIIYDDNIPDVFISPHQTHPLDLNSESFFTNREEQIRSHLQTLQQSSIEELKEIVKHSWENHHGKASLVSWDRFADLQHVQGLVSCFGSKVLSGICERLARDFRFTRSGVPDLVVWNPETLCVKIVEVKGPGDKLSSKQILWLDYLIKLEADAEVCLVEAVASKKLRK